MPRGQALSERAGGGRRVLNIWYGLIEPRNTLQKICGLPIWTETAPLTLPLISARRGRRQRRREEARGFSRSYGWPATIGRVVLV